MHGADQDPRLAQRLRTPTLSTVLFVCQRRGIRPLITSMSSHREWVGQGRTQAFVGVQPAASEWLTAAALNKRKDEQLHIVFV